MTLRGGDILASGQRSAQFLSAGVAVDEKIELKNVAPEEESLTKGVTVIDKRSKYDSEPVAKPEPKFPPKEYGTFSPILDRILVKRMPDDPDEELLEDGSSRNIKTGLITAAKYRQHSSTGVVLATGSFVVMGGVKIPMEEIVRPGDWALWGDYNSEVMHIAEDKVKDLCDAVEIDYIEDPDGVRIVRIQDVRAVKHVKGVMSEEEAFKKGYYWTKKKPEQLVKNPVLESWLHGEDAVQGGHTSRIPRVGA
jgi:co-chaperonin GroES (HSP10)